MIHAQSNATGRRRDCEANWCARKLFDAPLFAVTRKALVKAVRDAVRALGLDRSERQLIEFLAVCFGEQQFTHGLLCWPSNARIEKRTGMSERTIRRAIGKLRDRGLVVMRDSANGKRFPITNEQGEIVDARGFDLAPLHARASEFAERVRALDLEDRLRRQLRDDLTAARNAVRDLCAADPFPGHADILARAANIARPGKSASPEEYAAAIEAWELLAETARTLKYSGGSPVEMTGHAGHGDRHSEQDAESSIENFNGLRSAAQAATAKASSRQDARRQPNGIDDRIALGRMAADRAISKNLALWSAACPELLNMGPVNTIEGAAAIGTGLICACGLSKRAFESASARLGLLDAGLLGLFIVQRHADGEQAGGTPIRSPGGLFVMLARRIERSGHSLERDLLAMRRRRERKRQ